MSVRIHVPADGPLFEGHFPGRPILPGVAELSMVAHALAPPSSSGAIRAVPFLRFRQLVLPGDTLEVTSSTRSAEGATRFEVRRSGEVVSNGAIQFGIPEHAEDPRTSVAARPPRGVPSFDELIPHRFPMRFVERLLGEAEDGATCLARVPRACGLTTGGAAPALIAMEAAAQTAAIWEALRHARASGGPSARIGYLVSVSDVMLHMDTIPADADLFATVRLEAVMPPLSIYAVEVVTEGAVALRGSIGAYLSE